MILPLDMLSDEENEQINIQTDDDENDDDDDEGLGTDDEEEGVNSPEEVGV